MLNSPRALVILLHGVGSNSADMMKLARLWQPSLPGIAFAAPNAAYPFEMGAGFQWFSIAGVTQANRPHRIKAARDAFDWVVSTELERHGFKDHPEKVAFVGFSQGSMMLLDAIVSGRWAIAGGVAFSGRLASPPPREEG